MLKLPISVVVLAKNEEKNIKDCLESVINWVDEVIVVDDESQDRTAEIAENLGAKVLRRKMDIEGRHRNWAYSQAKNIWILSLDADERVTLELKEEIREILNSSIANKFSAFTIPRKNFIGNRWIRWAGLYPSAQLKLFRKDKFRWEEVEVHPKAILEGKCGHLKKDILHYTYRNWSDFLKKLNNQTTLEAKKWYKVFLENPKKANYKMNFLHTIWRVIDRFIRVFFVKKGYREGFFGFMLAYFSSLYQIVSYAKYKELKESNKRDNCKQFLL
ncbi:MAG: glycosyltransferase family 2 protein [Candidatus Aenigmatarchaeota archaeon]